MEDTYYRHLANGGARDGGPVNVENNQKAFNEMETTDIKLFVGSRI